MQDPQSKPTSSTANKAALDIPPLEFLPGVGPNRVPLLAKLGVRRAVDLLFLFPRSYQEVSATKTVNDFVTGQKCSILGIVESVDFRVYPNGRSAFGVHLQIPDGFVRLIWYNQEFRRHQIVRGMQLVATGEPKPTGVSWEMRHPDVILLAEGEEPPIARPKPVYPLTDGLKQHHVSKIVRSAIERALPSVSEALPDDFRQEHKLLPIHQAIEQVHSPNSIEESESARYRFIFQELLAYQLALQVRRHRLRSVGVAPRLPLDGKIHARILKRFGFDLTGDQLKSIDEICEDMTKEVPMNRLVQGDVGSGKTVVALYAMLLAVANGYQAALMAPTESLARQHYLRLKESLSDSSVEVEFLAGTISQGEKNDLLERIALGTVDLIIGTQALLSSKVQFEQLALVVIDEQHKFGVQQRAALQDDQRQPHYLVLSATPIPRTLTMTAFGDLDVSILREKPAGRAKVHTYLGKDDQESSWWEFVRQQLSEGRQSYVVTPRVQQSVEDDVAGAEETYQRLRDTELSGYTVDLLHGGMDSETSQQVLRRFNDGHTQVLVATTVIEVGIDVANATLMTIYDANRLGLSQLHQLRGRISRSTYPGYLCVFASKGVEPEEHERLNALASTTDGFELSELDMKIRGPGNLLGTNQHGLPPFRIADLVRDAEIVIRTREAAKKIIEEDPDLTSEKWSGMQSQVFNRHGSMLSFGSVG